jgi:hypothetical protein
MFKPFDDRLHVVSSASMLRGTKRHVQDGAPVPTSCPRRRAASLTAVWVSTFIDQRNRNVKSTLEEHSARPLASGGYPGAPALRDFQYRETGEVLKIVLAGRRRLGGGFVLRAQAFRSRFLGTRRSRHNCHLRRSQSASPVSRPSCEEVSLAGRPEAEPFPAM